MITTRPFGPIWAVRDKETLRAAASDVACDEWVLLVLENPLGTFKCSESYLTRIRLFAHC